MRYIWIYLFSFHRIRSANVILPSHLKRKRAELNSKSKRPKSIQQWDRNIICLPHTKESLISYPRKKYRAKLGALGLQGKIRLSSEMTVEEVQKEICSVFDGPMGGKLDFKFTFLQPAGTGTKVLTISAVSNTFTWTAHQVAKLGGYKLPIYILAQERLTVSWDSDVSLCS